MLIACAAHDRGSKILAVTDLRSADIDEPNRSCGTDVGGFCCSACSIAIPFPPLSPSACDLYAGSCGSNSSPMSHVSATEPLIQERCCEADSACH